MAPSVLQQMCTGRTCLKWSDDGSLSEHDHNELMKRLCAVDPALATSEACDFQNNEDLTDHVSPQREGFFGSIATESNTSPDA